MKILTDTQLIELCDVAVRRRRRVELAIVHRIIKTLIAAKCILSYSDGEDDYDDISEQAGVNVLLSCDEGYINTVYNDCSTFVYFVFGNDGPDVVNDYGTSLEEVLKPVFDWITAQENSGRF